MEFKIGSGLACLGLAVGVGQWLIPADQLPGWAKSVLILLSIFLFAGGLTLIIHAWKPLSVPITFSAWRRRLTLHDAALLSYEHFKRHGSLYAAMAEHRFAQNDNESREERILSWMAYFLSDKVPIYGREIPSHHYKRIGKEEIRRCHIDAGQNSLTPTVEQSPKFTDLYVKRSDVMKVVRNYRNAKFGEQ